jgi:hypothetical protein
VPSTLIVDGKSSIGISAAGFRRLRSTNKNEVVEYWNNGRMGYKFNDWVEVQMKYDVSMRHNQYSNPIFRYSNFPTNC